MPSAKYTPAEIEPKWDAFWVDKKTFRAPNPGDADFDPKKPKYYILDMFPYPSGDGLHVGHPAGYTATDIIARHKRMLGFNVLHPMGWDAFGLPAENYAVQHGVHPSITTARNIANMRRQIQSLGLSYDWDREVNTTDPGYYKWTQWIFTQIFKKGLAYSAEVPVWWCEAMGTVLANEEVIDGRSERGDHPCVRMPLRQWMLKITAYAERLLADLEQIEWPGETKTQQANWIGKSEGAEVDFITSIPDPTGGSAGRTERLRVFTTRPDTLYGATYMVLAPEHPLVKDLIQPQYAEACKKYIAEASKKSDLARTELAKEKTGVFTGAHAYNPVHGRMNPKGRVPIWISDYVLMSYGTGAIMAVPAHDTRDMEFAKEFNLPLIPVVMPPDAWLKAHAPKGKEAEAIEALRDLFMAAPGDFTEAFCDDGIAVNSPDINGKPTPEAKQTIIATLTQNKSGRPTVQYRLRDWIFSRQRYWGEPFPVLHRQDGKIEIVPDELLPVALPEMEDFKPTGTMDPPLAKAKQWVNAVSPTDAKPAKREVNTMPQWAGSCWYYLRYLDPKNSKQGWSKEAEKYWMPVDLYVGGREHAVLHLLYARFWHKVLYDLGHVSTPEPFKKLFHQGMITAFAYKDETGRLTPTDEVDDKGEGVFVSKATGKPVTQIVAKMSKTLKNVVNPDEVVKEYGADTLRLYEMFMGPLDASKPWNPRDVPGVYRFLQRAWRLVIQDDESHPGAGEIRANLKQDGSPEPELERLLHKTIKKVGGDIERMAFNTAISTLMVFSNEALKPAAGSNAPASKMTRAQAERFVLVLAPFAPHLAEELWQRLGHANTLAYEPWPKFDEKLTVDAELELAVQVNGKVRGKVTVAADASEDAVKEAALAAIADQLQGKTVAKVIVVKGRLVNVAVK